MNAFTFQFSLAALKKLYISKDLEWLGFCVGLKAFENPLNIGQICW